MTERLFKALGAPEEQILSRSKGTLCLYAALKKAGRFQSEADEKVGSISLCPCRSLLTIGLLQFDATLRARTPEFGLRNLDDIVALAEAQGLKLISEEALGGGTNLFLQFQFSSSG